MNYSLLTIYADLVDDLERSRIATENRIRSLCEAKGMAGSPEEKRLILIANGLGESERKAINELKRAVKAHPLGPWIAAQAGVGEKTAGRLLGVLGDPAMRFDPETGELTPRTVSQLWSYCGYGDARKQRRTRGMTQEEAFACGNPTLKMRVYLIAEACVKNRGSAYRAVYDAAREKYADAIHDEECKRCGPSGKPAQPGSPLSDGHKHARAMRAVSKNFLRDLWAEARRAHAALDPQTRIGSA